MMNSNNHLPQISGVFGSEVMELPKILVLGMGESGCAMAKWATSQGAQVIMRDTREASSIGLKLQDQIQELSHLGIEHSFGKDLENIDLSQIQILAMSPGLSPLDADIAALIKRAQQSNVKVWGELDFFSNALKALGEVRNYHPKTIAITGTNGKTTTTALSGVICKKVGKSVAVAGNISPSLLDKLSQCLLDDQLPEIWILELSSYQLFYSENFDPDVATVLNVTEDHLDWHGDMSHYCAAKRKIFGKHTIPILNRDDKYVMSMMGADDFENRRIITFGMDTPLEPDSFGIVGDMSGGIDWLAWTMPSEDAGMKKRRRSKASSEEFEQPLQIKRLIPAEALLIKGRHNATNTLAALALGQALDLSMGQLLHGLRDYRGEPHRVQSIGVIDDVEYIDDSKGTNVGATIAAINGLGVGTPSKKIILIAGGDGKGQDFRPLREPIVQYAKHVILLGKDAQGIEDALEDSSTEITRVATIEEAVQVASQIAQTGDKVLLSPACASLDMFRDYVHRAEVFSHAVNELIHQTQSIGVVS